MAVAGTARSGNQMFPSNKLRALWRRLEIELIN
jgi:hypothetical protein